MENLMKAMKMIIMVLLFVASSVTYAVTTTATPSESLKSLLSHMQTIKANFKQNLYNGKGRVIQQSAGTMAIKRPGKFRWYIKTPSKQLILTNGKTLWLYDKALMQVTIESVKKGIGKTPASLLSGDPKTLTTFFNVSKKNAWFILSPKSKDSGIGKVMLRFQGKRLKSMQLIDKLGQTSVLNFSVVRMNQKVNSSLFSFKVPKGVDVIRQ